MEDIEDTEEVGWGFTLRIEHWGSGYILGGNEILVRQRVQLPHLLLSLVLSDCFLLQTNVGLIGGKWARLVLPE